MQSCTSIKHGRLPLYSNTTRTSFLNQSTRLIPAAWTSLFVPHLQPCRLKHLQVYLQDVCPCWGFQIPHEWTIERLSPNNLLSGRQTGFATTAAVNVINDLIESKGRTRRGAALSIDFSKTFDPVDQAEKKEKKKRAQTYQFGSVWTDFKSDSKSSIRC